MTLSEQTTIPPAASAWALRFARPLRAQPLAVAAIVAVLLGTYVRILDARLPLWLDEVWTGVIVTQPNFGELVRQMLLDANAPLYYIVMHYWSQVFGLSETALRFPAFIFGALVPAVALIPTKAIGRDSRFLWAIFLALWIPGIWYSQEARSPSLLMCLATGCTIAYVRLLELPDLRRAALWVLLASLCILTHYYAALLIGCQGLAYLWMHRVRALRTWPTALLFVPALVWCAVHLPSILRLAGDNTWHSRLSFGDMPAIVDFMVGELARAAVLSTIFCVLLVGARMMWSGRKENIAADTAESLPPSRPAIVAASTALAGAVLVVIMGMLTPSFVDRYLVAFMPGILLGAALGTAWFARRQPLAPLGIAAVLAAFCVNWAVGARAGGFKEAYNFEGASRTLMAAGTKHLVFLLDSPTAAVCDQDQLASVGGFYFQRAGHPVTVETVPLRPGDDPNRRLLTAAGAKPGTGILWVYDLAIRGTAAKNYSPRLTDIDPVWQCQHFGNQRFNVLACHRGDASGAAPAK